MNYDGYRLLFIVSLCISILLFLLSLFLFIRLRIPKIIGELTGLSAKKNIKKMKFISHQNSGNIFKFNSGGINNSGKTDKSEKISKYKGNTFIEDEDKAKLSLHENDMDVDKTEILQPKIHIDENEFLTEVLTKDTYNTGIDEKKNNSDMHVVEDITFIHNNEGR